MENTNIYKLIENMNKENIKLMDSEYYKKGKRVSYIEYFEIKKIINGIKKKNKEKKIRKYNKSNTAKSIINNNDNIEKVRIAVYTSITGNYDNINIPNIQFDNVDYYIITDNPEKYKKYDKYYKIIENKNENPILNNRYAKFHPFEYFKEYDYAIYIDGNIEIYGDIRKLVNYCNEKTGIAMHTHRDRNCIYDEAEVCKILKKGNKQQIDEQIKSYKEEGFPKNYGMLEANVIVSKIGNESMEKIMKCWWEDFCNKKSYRDQLSLPYILWKNNYNIEDVGILGYNVYENYIFRIHKHK